jgi:nicotinate-nucleotide pyrophosphorylase (carboxylating)
MIKDSLIKHLVEEGLKEDIGAGDITSNLVISEKRQAEFQLIAKQDLVVCGLKFFKECFAQIDSRIIVEVTKEDGDFIAKGEVFAKGSGGARNILAAERVALNFLQYLSGIATYTNLFVKEIEGCKTKILDTRKTLPLYRMPAKYAVKIGGASNHRVGLFDAILIKDNHIKAAGNISQAVELAKQANLLVEVECETKEQVIEAINAKAETIMLDNMNCAQITEALGIIKNQAKTEISGNVTLANIKDLAKLGADFISVGSLTHSAPAADISLKITL